MRASSRILGSPWILAAAIVVLLGAHGLAFYLLWHLILSATLGSVIVIVVAVKHLGLLSSAVAGLRKRD